MLQAFKVRHGYCTSCCYLISKSTGLLCNLAICTSSSYSFSMAIWFIKNYLCCYGISILCCKGVAADD